MFDELTNHDEGPKGEMRASPRTEKDIETTKWNGDEDMDLFLAGP